MKINNYKRRIIPALSSVEQLMDSAFSSVPREYVYNMVSKKILGEVTKVFSSATAVSPIVRSVSDVRRIMRESVRFKEDQS